MWPACLKLPTDSSCRLSEQPELPAFSQAGCSSNPGSRWLGPPKDGAPIVSPGIVPLFFDPFFEVPGWNKIFLEALRQSAELSDRILFVHLPHLSFLHSGLQDTDGFVINFNRHGKRMPILAPMGKGEACRI